MKQKMLHSIVTIAIIGTFILGVNHHLRTEEKKKHAISPALMASTATSLAFAAIGSQLPYTSPAAAAIMRRYFLTTTAAQTAASTGISLATNPELTRKKAAADLGYGLYSAIWVEALRRIPTTATSQASSNIFLKKLLAKLPADVLGRNTFFRRIAMGFLVSQAVEVAGKNLAAPAYCALKQKVGEYTATLTPERLEETAACLSFTE